MRYFAILSTPFIAGNLFLLCAFRIIQFFRASVFGLGSPSGDDDNCIVGISKKTLCPLFHARVKIKKIIRLFWA